MSFLCVAIFSASGLIKIRICSVVCGGLLSSFVKQEFDVTDWNIAFCLAQGWTKVVTAQMAGITERTVYDRINGIKKKKYDEIIQKWQLFLREQRVEAAEELNEKTIQVALKKLLGPAYKAYEDALGSSDLATRVKAADKVLERTLGKAVQTNVNVISGSVDHNHKLSSVPGLFAQRLIGAAQYIPDPALVGEGDVIDVEPE